MSNNFFGNKAGDYDETCDIYSYGMILYEIVTRKVPFMDVSAESFLKDPCPNIYIGIWLLFQHFYSCANNLSMQNW